MGQKIAVDTTLLIYLLEQNEKYLEQVREIFHKIQRGHYEAVFASIGLIELMIGPKKQKQFYLANQFRHQVVTFPNLIIGNLNENVIELASSLSARYNIKIPDAIHIATAIDFQAEKFITNDFGLQKIKEIAVEVL